MQMLATAEKLDEHFTIELSSSNYALGPNEDVLVITIHEDGIEKVIESHFPKGGFEMFDNITKKSYGFVKTEKIIELYRRFLMDGHSYVETAFISVQKLIKTYKGGPSDGDA